MGIYKNNIKKKRIDKKKLYCLLITIVIIFWILPISNIGSFEIIDEDGLVDRSLRIGLNWGDKLGLEFGKDIINTYGPLYFLSGGLISNIYKPVYLIGNILSIIFWFLVIFLFLTNIVDRIKFSDIKEKIISHTVIILGLFTVFYVIIMLHDLLPILSFLLLFNVLIKNYSKIESTLWLVCIGLILAIVSLVKFSYVMSSLTLIILAIISFVISKKTYNIITLILSYLGFLFVIWMIIEKSAKNLISYFKNSLSIALGYSENVQKIIIWEAKYIIIFAIIIFVLWTGIFIFGLVKKDKNIIFYFLLSFPILFLYYKEGFTRQDSGHLAIYFAFIIYLLIFTILIFGKKLWKIFPLFLALILFAVPFTKQNFIPDIYKHISGNIQEIKTFINTASIKSDDEYEIMLEKDRNTARENFPIHDCTISKIKSSDAVDIFPWDIYVPYIYNLNWSPRPIFQSYSAYKPELDNINSTHFTGDDAPDKIIYRIDSIDNRYAIFDEPATFREIIKNYEVIYSDEDGWGILEKKKYKSDFEKEIISKETVKFGEVIKIPDIKDGYLFCNINIKMNLFGKVKTFFYKGDYLYIKFCFNNREINPITKRFVRENGKNGFFISRYIDDIFDLENVLHQQCYYNNIINDIKSIEITNSNDIAYADEFEIEFYTLVVPISERVEVSESLNFKKEDDNRFLIKLDQLGNGSIINGEVVIEGWAVDLIDKDYRGKVYILFYDGLYRKDKNCLGITYRYLLRNDIAEHFKIDDYRFSGFKFLLDTAKLENGQHNIFIYALNEGGYYSKEKFEFIVDN